MDSIAAHDLGENAVLSTSNVTSNGPTRNLSSTSAGAMNALNNITNTEIRPSAIENTGAERPCQPDQPEAPEITANAITSEKAPLVAMPHATNLTRLNTTPLPSITPRDRSPILRSSPLAVTSSVRTISVEFGSLRSNSNFSIAEDNTASNGTISPNQPFSSAVGRASLGKSGRVIEKLMAENDMLKRDLQIAKLAADESKQDAKMMEGRMEALSSENEARMHDAAVTKAMLKKRDRQVADLRASIDHERQRANAAVESERNWRAAMEKLETESKSKVDEATNHAMLMEGRNNTLTSYWKEQGAEVEGLVKKLRGDIRTLLDNRKDDSERMDILENLIDQRTHAMDRLEKQKQEIVGAFEAYKAEQEDQLREIRTRAVGQENMNEALNADMNTTLGELRWVLRLHNHHTEMQTRREGSDNQLTD